MGKKKPAGGGLRAGEVARGRLAAGQRPISEATRLDVVAALLRFREAADESEFAFPPGLSNDDRALVHQECRKYGFTSKSHGKGEARFVRVSKPRAPGAGAGGDGGGAALPPAGWLPLGPRSQRTLAKLFAQDPLSEAEAAALAAEVGGGAAAGSGAAPSAGGTGRRGRRGRENGKQGPQQGGKRGGGGGGGGENSDVGRGGRAENFSPERVARELQDLHGRRRPAIEGPRARLPIAEHRARIVEAVAQNRVVLVAGSTGCGKTTQVPQYLLEAEWAAGRACRVVCTQPRRLSAVSVADRIAAEMGEEVGRSVGYSIRLEGRGGPESSVVFCTNGVLLRQLTQTGGLAPPAGGAGGRGSMVAGATHLIVDEIHERDKFADFLLIILRDLLAAEPRLRVVLMSATMQMGLFAQYFGGCPVVEVPGFTYPVEQLYLDDIVPELYGGGGRLSPAGAAGGGGPECPAEVQQAIMQAFLQGSDTAFAHLMELTGVALAGASADPRLSDGVAPLVNARHAQTGATPLMVAAGKGRAAGGSLLMANGADPELRSRDGGRAVDWATRFGHFTVAEALLQCAETLAQVRRTTEAAQELSRYQMGANPEEVDLDLVVRILRYIALQPIEGARKKGQIGAGAVLVFLPGWDEISRLKDLLEASPPFSDSSRFRVLPLHSMVPSSEQRKVFQRPGAGVMKIVLATNIAETAVTIDDIVYVINSGRHKEKSYDAYTAVSTLQAAWVSKASEKQRKGRAGRCQPGVCFHLYSQQRSESLDEFQLPELKRTPLEEIGLQIKVLLEGGGVVVGGSMSATIADFLSKAVEPPSAKAVDNAVELLRDIGALAPDGEVLTELGRHLAAFPLPPQVGKMLLFGCLFRCLDPVLTAACAAAYRDPWVIPVEPRARRAADEARFGAARRAGGHSDHLGTVQAYAEWRQARARGWEWKFSQKGFLNNSTLSMLDKMRGQLLGELQRRRVVAGLGKGKGGGGGGGLEQASARGNGNPALVRAVLGCGLYPMVGEVRTVDAASGGGAGGARRDAPKVNMMVRSGEKVRVHPRSVAAKMDVTWDDRWARPLLCFQELTRGEALLHVKECTRVPAVAVFLVAGSVKVFVEPARGEEAGAGGDEPDMGPPAPIVLVDGWLRYRVPAELLPWLLGLRRRLLEAFACLVEGKQTPQGGALQRAVEVAAEVMTLEGG